MCLQPLTSYLTPGCSHLTKQFKRGTRLKVYICVNIHVHAYIHTCTHTCIFITHTQLVMSSDKLGSIQRPILDLDLDISESGHKRKEHLELSKEELEALLSSLDAASKVCCYLRE